MAFGESYLRLQKLGYHHPGQHPLIIISECEKAYHERTARKKRVLVTYLNEVMEEDLEEEWTSLPMKEYRGTWVFSRDEIYDSINFNTNGKWILDANRPEKDEILEEAIWPRGEGRLLRFGDYEKARKISEPSKEEIQEIQKVTDDHQKSVREDEILKIESSQNLTFDSHRFDFYIMKHCQNCQNWFPGEYDPRFCDKCVDEVGVEILEVITS